MLTGTAFPPSPDRLSHVGGQASSGYVPERLYPPPSRSTPSCGTTLLRELTVKNRVLIIATPDLRTTSIWASQPTVRDHVQVLHLPLSFTPTIRSG